MASAMLVSFSVTATYLWESNMVLFYIGSPLCFQVSHTYSAVGNNHIKFTASDSYLDHDLVATTNNTVYELITGVEISAAESGGCQSSDL